ncbi:MAG: OmpA family protein [Flavobacteriales bacterium]|nr:OmpA family protein [Flavobacteriales bacterium]
MKQNQFSVRYPMLLVLLLCASLFRSQLVTEKAEVFFASDKSTLTRNAQKSLDDFLAQLTLNDGCSLRIYGHTDSDGSTDYNITLAQQRCESVMSYMLSKNFDETRIAIAAFGEEKPVSENETDTGKQANRRVEMLVDCRVLQSVIAAATEEIPEEENNMDKLFAILRGEPEVFDIDPQRDTLIVCKGGSKLLFNANSFKLSSADNGKPVNINVREVFCKSDMILQNMTTGKDKMILESGGMLDIAASVDGKSVKLKNGSEYTALIPSDDVDPRMELFDGKRLNSRNKTVNWKQRSVNNFNYYYLPDVLNCQKYIYRNVRCNMWCKMRMRLSGDYRKFMRSQRRVRDISCKTTTQLKKQYKVKTYDQLVEALWKEQFAKYGVVNIEDYWAAVNAEAERKQVEQNQFLMAVQMQMRQASTSSTIPDLVW